MRQYQKIFYLSTIVILILSCSRKTISFDYDGHIYVKIKKINNKKVNGDFIYDTGAPFFYIDSSFCVENKIKFKNIQKGIIGGIGNGTKNTYKIKDTVTYAFKKIKNYSDNSTILNFKSILGKNADGILGVNSFNNKSHKIDYVKREISLIDNFNGYDKIKFEFKNYRILVPLEIRFSNNSYIKGSFLLDTGSSITCLTSNHNIDNIEQIQYLSTGGTGGETKGFTTYADEIMIGNYKILKHLIDISEDSSGSLSSTDYAGIIGNDVLDNFDLIIDLKQNYIYIKPNEKFNIHRKFLFKSFSYIDRTDIDDSWLISYIYIDTDAYKNGLRLNDKVIAIDGELVKNLDRLNFYKNLKIDQKLEFTVIREGKTIKINFALNKFLG